MPGVEGNAPIGRRKRLVPLVDGSPVLDGRFELTENFAADCAQVAGLAVDHRVVEIQVLVAGDARDVGVPSVVILELITLHSHRTCDLRVVVIVQFFDQGNAVVGFVETRTVVEAAVLDEQDQDNTA